MTLEELTRKLADALGLLGDLEDIADWQIEEKILKDRTRTAEHNLLVREDRKLRAEIEALKAHILDLNSQLRATLAIRERLAALEKAAEPFREVGRLWLTDRDLVKASDEHHPGVSAVTVGDFRRIALVKPAEKE